MDAARAAGAWDRVVSQGFIEFIDEGLGRRCGVL